MLPGMVTVVVIMVRFPEALVPVQKLPPRLAVFKVMVLLFGPPVVFQVTTTLDTSNDSCGFVIVMLIVLGATMLYLMGSATI